MLALFNCNTVLHVLFWFDCGDGCVLMIFSFWWTCLFSICCFLCWTCVCYLSFFVLGHVSFVWLFAGYFWDPCVLLELFALGHVSCVFTCASWILLSIPYIRVLFCVCLNLFFDFFLLATTVLLERCFCYLCDVLCLLVFTWACPSVSCSLWVFSMGRICISILAQVTHVWLIFSFLVGRHFGLVGIEAFVGLGLPLTWGSCCFLCFLLQTKSSLISLCIFCSFCTCYATFVHLLCTFLHFLCIFNALVMHFLCIFMHFLCTFYALFVHFYALFMRP